VRPACSALRAGTRGTHTELCSPTNESESAVYAIVRSGGQQQKVAVGDVIEIDKVASEVGDSVKLPVVLLVDGENVTSDADALGKASVTVEVLGATKGPKITILKYKNKTGYRKRQGHRQKYTQVKVTDISA
jgi:large subunit ribosomal protein L21